MRFCHLRSLTALTILLAAADASYLRPPVLPLVVRNPYLSTWLANAREAPWSQWPMFYEGQHVRLRCFLLKSSFIATRRLRGQMTIGWNVNSCLRARFRECLSVTGPAS